MYKKCFYKYSEHFKYLWVFVFELQQSGCYQFNVRDILLNLNMYLQFVFRFYNFILAIKNFIKIKVNMQFNKDFAKYL